MFTRFGRALLLAAAVASGCASSVFAQGKSGAQAFAIGKLIPAGYRLFEEIRGDLNGDGIDDLALVIKATDKTKTVRDEDSGELWDYNHRGIMVFFKTADGYRLALENRRCFLTDNEKFDRYFVPSIGVTIRKGNLYVKYIQFKGDDWQYTFRYRNSEFELIGYDRSYAGAAGSTERKNSTNFLTKKQLMRVCAFSGGGCCDGDCKNIFKETWSDIIVKDPVTLRTIDFKKFDIDTYASNE